MTTVHAYAAHEKGSPLAPFEYTLGEIGSDEVDIKVESCGICHSDITLLDNEWGFNNYPIVAGHEVVGTIMAMGEHVKYLKVGQRVGLGWYSGSCMHCYQCLSGDQHLCAASEQTIIGRHGGFADMVRCSSEWVIVLPDNLDTNNAGPLFCGGIAVFNPLVQFNIRPTQRVGVIGIGGLGHMALQIFNKWGCEVTAFSSSPSKEVEAKQMGAHYFVNSKDSKAIEALAGQFDFILNTANANFDWPMYINALAPRGRLHTLGITPDPIPAEAFQMVVSQRCVSGSPLGSPATIQDMLQFCARHNIQPLTEHFAMKDINKALEHLRAGKARYRIVLHN